MKTSFSRLLYFGSILLCLLGFSRETNAHPSIAIVKDSKGNIYYSDLVHVWKISKGETSICLANVHTHELFVDRNDNLFGEHLWYAGDASKKFYHYLWRLDADGSLDTLVSATQAYIREDFSMARDNDGNEFYCKFKDSLHLFKRSAAGVATLVTTYDFRGVTFFLPQPNGELFFSKANTVYRVSPQGEVSTVAADIGAPGRAMLWGIWQDVAGSVYVAVFNDGVIKKIDKGGQVTEVYKSASGWAPAHGVFDNDNRLWVLEWSDKNEVRVVQANVNAQTKKKNKLILPVGVGAVVILAVVFGFRQRFHAKTQS